VKKTLLHQNSLFLALISHEGLAVDVLVLAQAGWVLCSLITFHYKFDETVKNNIMSLYSYLGRYVW